MLHPALGSSLDPLASWQVDTQDIDDLIALYQRHLSDVRDPEKSARRLGMLWKKLATAPRLARLIVDYVNVMPPPAAPPDELHRISGPRRIERALAAAGWNRSRPAARPRVVFVQDDPLYDFWIDG